jgi:hypothetical protein
LMTSPRRAFVLGDRLPGPACEGRRPGDPLPLRSPIFPRHLARQRVADLHGVHQLIEKDSWDTNPVSASPAAIETSARHHRTSSSFWRRLTRTEKSERLECRAARKRGACCNAHSCHGDGRDDHSAALRRSISCAPCLIRGMSSRPNSTASFRGSKPRMRKESTPSV